MGERIDAARDKFKELAPRVASSAVGTAFMAGTEAYQASGTPKEGVVKAAIAAASTVGASLVYDGMRPPKDVDSTGIGARIVQRGVLIGTGLGLTAVPPEQYGKASIALFVGSVFAAKRKAIARRI